MTRRILILEEDPEAQCVLGRFLARNGYSISYATDHADAVAEARKSPYDLFLLDIAEGGTAAAGAFLRSLRAGQSPPVLLLTSDPPDAGTPAQPPGVNAAVNKRARNFFDQLLDQINQALRNGHHAARQPLAAPGRT